MGFSIILAPLYILCFFFDNRGLVDSVLVPEYTGKLEYVKKMSYRCGIPCIGEFSSLFSVNVPVPLIQSVKIFILPTGKISKER